MDRGRAQGPGRCRAFALKLAQGGPSRMTERSALTLIADISRPKFELLNKIPEHAKKQKSHELDL